MKTIIRSISKHVGTAKTKIQIAVAAANDYLRGDPSFDEKLEGSHAAFARYSSSKTFDVGPVALASDSIVAHPAPYPALPGRVAAEVTSKKVSAKAGKLPAGKIDAPAAAALFDLKPSTFMVYRSKGTIKGLPAEKFGFRVVFDREKAEVSALRFKIARDKRIAAGKRKSAAASRARSKAA